MGRQVETLEFDHVTSSSPRGVISTTKIAVTKLTCTSVSRHFNDDLTNHLLTQQTVWSFKKIFFLTVSETSLPSSSVSEGYWSGRVFSKVSPQCQFMFTSYPPHLSKEGVREGQSLVHMCTGAHIYTRECAYTCTHQAVASKEKMLNIVKKYYKVTEGKY